MEKKMSGNRIGILSYRSAAAVISLCALFFFFSMVTSSLAENKPIELSLASLFPPSSPPAKQVDEWIEKIEKDSNGQLSIRHYPSNVLIAGPDMRVGVKSGVADLGCSFIYKVDPGFELGQHLTHLNRGQTTDDGLNILNDLWDQYPELMASQWKDFKVIWIVPTTPTIFYTIKKPVRKLEDLKGLQLRVPDAVTAKIAMKLGAKPVFMSTGDWITSLDKGTTDGAITTVGSMLDFKIGDKFKYATYFPIGLSINFMIMNKESWEKLPPEMKKVIDDNMEWARQSAINLWKNSEKNSVAFSKEKGIKFIWLSEKEYKRWSDAIEPVYEEIAKDLDSKGFPGTKFVNFATERSNFYSKKHLKSE